MPSRDFDTFIKLIEYRNRCPICSNELEYEISTTIYNFDEKEKTANLQNPPYLNLKNALENNFNKTLNAKEEKIFEEKIFVKFKPSETKILYIEKLNTTIDTTANTLTGNYDGSLSYFHIKIYCNNAQLGINEYEAMGEFSAEANEESYFKDKDIYDKYLFKIENINLYHEIYELYNVFQDEERPNGNRIKIINDYNISKTSFSLAELNLDGTNQFYKEKRIDLVDDDYFKFGNPKKVFSRINSILLLSEK
jgi:hypothetical protein